MNPALLGFGVALVCCLIGASGHSLWAVESLSGTNTAAAQRVTEQRSAGAERARAERERAQPDDDVAGPSSSTPGVVSEDARVDGVPVEPGELDHTKFPDYERPEQSVIHPLARLDEKVIRELVTYDLASLGPMSIGDPNRGVLRNSVQFPAGPYWRRNDPDRAWGTAETIQFMIHAIERVNEEYPETPVLYLGDLSEEKGGSLKRHKSHQSGRDVDVGYYYSDYMEWYRRATAKNLDRPRTWLLIRTLLADSPVEYIFMDTSIQKLLRQEALAQGEDPVWLSRVFDGNPGRNDSIIRHRRGHAGHFHVRFDNPIAEFSAARAYPWLVEGRLLPSRVAKYKKRRPRARL
jgi:murein endopeptidase